MELKDLVSRTIKSVNGDHHSGCFIEFEDGTKIVLRTLDWPEEGGYMETIIEKV